MKAFWAIVLLLVAAGVAVLLLGKDRAAPVPLPTPVSQPGPTGVATSPPVQSATPANPLSVQAPPTEKLPADARPTPAVPAAQTPPAHQPGPAHASANVGMQTAPLTTSMEGGSLADFEILPGDITTQPDGTTLIDKRFTIKGDGTQANPFRVPWEMLISANEAFDPSQGLRKFPQRIAMLEGKHVRLNGYVAFPLMVQRPRELLAMLNQWDGCCIGVPPTPYDAVEVKLTKAVTGKEKFAIAGQVEGIFRTKPYVQKDWLVGLYVIEDASFVALDSGEEATPTPAPEDDTTNSFLN